MNLDDLDHPLAARAVDLAGQDVAVGPTKFRLRALGARNIELMIFMADAGLKNLAPREAMPHLPQLLAAAAVMGWDHLSAAGVPVPYSRETAVELFTRHPLLAQEVFFAAIALAQDGREEAAVADAKKSPRGGANGAARSSTLSAQPEPACASPH